MKRKSCFCLLLVLVLGASLLTGCFGKQESDESTQPPVVEQAPTPTETPEEELPVATPVPGEFADVSGLEFWFGSGAGGWCTTLQIQPDGSFTGIYHDSEMGITGDDYPNGTEYICYFYGTLAERTKVNEYSSTALVTSLNYQERVGTEEIRDGIRYIYSDIYGFGSNALLTFYSANSPLDELPEGFLSWVNSAITGSTSRLGFVGLYYAEGETGFSSYPATAPAVVITQKDPTESSNESSSAAAQPAATPAPTSAIASELDGIAQKADAISKRMKTEDLSQTELNTLAEQMYTLWDTELNSIWSRMKKTLSEGDMAKVTQDEIKWIGEKEAAMQNAAAEYTGGSLYSMTYYTKGAELTKARVYVLADYLK